MKNDPYRVAYLVAGFIRNTLDDRERDELDAWVEASDENMKLFGELTDDNNIQQNLANIENIDKQTELKKLLSRVAVEEKLSGNRGRFWIYAAAATAALLVGIFLVYRYTSVVDTTKPQPGTVVKADILPAPNKATLTMQDGTVIDITSLQKGSIKNSDGSQIQKITDDAVNYEPIHSVAGETVFHVLTVPGGGQFSVTLSDGTKVWLNAASSLRYPNNFTGTRREVELTGEAYFEVTKNERHFIVKTPGTNEIKVLGTKFNVKAYTDENAQAITLLEGSVEVNTSEKKIKLAPGEQALLSENDLTIDRSIDTESVMAWKNNTFKFTDAPIEDIMKQVQRCYSAEVIFETKTTHHFNATIARDVPVSKLLHYLELTGHVHFKIENNKVIVMK